MCDIYIIKWGPDFLMVTTDSCYHMPFILYSFKIFCQEIMHLNIYLDYSQNVFFKNKIQKYTSSPTPNTKIHKSFTWQWDLASIGEGKRSSAKKMKLKIGRENSYCGKPVKQRMRHPCAPIKVLLFYHFLSLELVSFLNHLCVFSYCFISHPCHEGHIYCLVSRIRVTAVYIVNGSQTIRSMSIPSWKNWG